MGNEDYPILKNDIRYHDFGWKFIKVGAAVRFPHTCVEEFLKKINLKNFINVEDKKHSKQLYANRQELYGEKKVTVGFRCHPKHKLALSKIVKEHDLTISEFFDYVMEKYLQNDRFMVMVFDKHEFDKKKDAYKKNLKSYNSYLKGLDDKEYAKYCRR